MSKGFEWDQSTLPRSRSLTRPQSRNPIRGRISAFLCGGVLFCGCLVSNGGNSVDAGLGPLAPYSYKPIGVEFQLPNTVSDRGPTLSYAPGFKQGRLLQNANNDPILAISFYLADRNRDWLGRSQYIEQDLGHVDSLDIMIAERSGRRYEWTKDVELDRVEHHVRNVRIVLPADERLFVFEAGIDEWGYRSYRDDFEAMVASIRIDPSDW